MLLYLSTKTRALIVAHIELKLKQYLAIAYMVLFEWIPMHIYQVRSVEQ